MPVYISAFQASISGARGNPGRRASRLPWAFIFRAVGANPPGFCIPPLALIRLAFVFRRWRLSAWLLYSAVGAYPPGFHIPPLALIRLAFIFAVGA